ncbi:hypothetical protein [Endozoicomonas sp.]|uniref:hypothetical protein n=1 Tax=Endozoicomonas sp. TaxID=1892382 RepID=UPI00383A0028
MAKTKKKSKKKPPKVKKLLTPEQKRIKKEAKAERQKKYQWICINGKQVRIKRPPSDEELLAEEEMIRNADPIWLHQNELWEYMQPETDLWNDDLPEDTRYAELVEDFWEYPEPEWLQCEKSEGKPSAKFSEVDDQEIPF